MSPEQKAVPDVISVTRGQLAWTGWFEAVPCVKRVRPRCDGGGIKYDVRHPKLARPMQQVIQQIEGRSAATAKGRSHKELLQDTDASVSQKADRADDRQRSKSRHRGTCWRCPEDRVDLPRSG